MEDERTMRRRTVKIDRRAEHRDLDQNRRDEQAHHEGKQHSTTLPNSSQDAKPQLLRDGRPAASKRAIVARNCWHFRRFEALSQPCRRSKSRMNSTSASTPAWGNAL